MGCLIKLSLLIFQPLIVIYRSGNAVYHHWGYTSIYWPFSYQSISLGCWFLDFEREQTANFCDNNIMQFWWFYHVLHLWKYKHSKSWFPGQKFCSRQVPPNFNYIIYSTEHKKVELSGTEYVCIYLCVCEIKFVHIKSKIIIETKCCFLSNTWNYAKDFVREVANIWLFISLVSKVLFTYSLA